MLCFLKFISVLEEMAFLWNENKHYSSMHCFLENQKYYSGWTFKKSHFGTKWTPIFKTGSNKSLQLSWASEYIWNVVRICWTLSKTRYADDSSIINYLFTKRQIRVCFQLLYFLFYPFECREKWSENAYYPQWIMQFQNVPYPLPFSHYTRPQNILL